MLSGGGKVREEGTALLKCYKRLIHIFIDYLLAVGGLALISNPYNYNKLSLFNKQWQFLNSKLIRLVKGRLSLLQPGSFQARAYS